jgi:hypothetical protein
MKTNFLSNGENLTLSISIEVLFRLVANDQSTVDPPEKKDL